MKHKKLIEFGWDIPSVCFVRDNIAQMEARPFDGVVMRLMDQHYNRDTHDEPTVNAHTSIFTHRPVPQDIVDQCLDDAARIQFNTFTENFILMWCTADEGYDWFSESDWESTLHTARNFTRVAKAGGLKGVLFDPEPYTATELWKHSFLSARDGQSRTFDDYAAQLRKRGAAFMRVMQDELPDAIIISLFLINHLPLSQWKPYISLDARKSDLSDRRYGLLPFFLAGMLDAAAPGVTIHDGNEHAYYYTHSLEHVTAAKAIREDAREALTEFMPGIGPAYDRHMRISSAAYHDYYLRPELFESWFQGRGKPPFFGNFLSREDRLRWLEHNVYYALSTCDDYVWWYGEEMDWWRGHVEADVIAVVESARRKVANGEPLSFDEALYQAFAEARRASEQAHLNVK